MGNKRRREIKPTYDVHHDIETIILNGLAKCSNDIVGDFLFSLYKEKENCGQFLHVENNDSDTRLMNTTYRHSLNVAYLAAIIQSKNRNELNYIEVIESALLHDIGKMKLPQRLIDSGKRLNAYEHKEIKTHTSLGYNILQDDHYFRTKVEVLKSALQHHERLDGTGYPNGLTGESISKTAKAIAIADSYEAMSSSRGYNTPKKPINSLAEIQTQVNSYEKRYVKALIEWFNSKASSFG